MSEASRGTGQQVNFTLDEHWHLVLRVIAEADGVSVPELIRPVVLRYLRNRLRDEDLREAIARIEQHRLARRRAPDNITAMPKVRGRARRPKPSQAPSKRATPPE